MATYSPDQFADALLATVAKAPKETVGVVRKGALNVKNDARRNVQISAPIHNAHAYTAINFDVDAEGTAVVAEIGYDKGGPGDLGNLLEFGGGGDRSPAHRDLGRALDAEEPRFERALGDMGERILPG